MLHLVSDPSMRGSACNLRSSLPNLTTRTNREQWVREALKIPLTFQRDQFARTFPQGAEKTHMLYIFFLS